MQRKSLATLHKEIGALQKRLNQAIEHIEQSMGPIAPPMDGPSMPAVHWAHPTRPTGHTTHAPERARASK